MTVAATLPGIQRYNAPRGLFVALLKGGIGFPHLRTLVTIGLGASGNWPIEGEPHRVHSYRAQTKIAAMLGVDRRTVSRHVCELRDWTHDGEPVLRTTREGSTAGCLAYGVLDRPKGSTDARHIRRDVLELEAVRALTCAAFALWVALRDDYWRAAGSGWLDCQIKGDDQVDEDRGGPLCLADRYNMAPSTVRRSLAELETAGLIKRRQRQDDTGRDAGVSIRMFDVPPSDAPVPAASVGWLEGLAGRVRHALEDMRRNGALLELGVAWSELQGARSAAAVWKVAKRLRDWIRTARGRRYPVRTLARACTRVLSDRWARQAAAEDVDHDEITALEHAEAAGDFGPSAPDGLPGVIYALPEQGPAAGLSGEAFTRTPDGYRVDRRKVWALAIDALRRIESPGTVAAIECSPSWLDLDPADGLGPVLWIGADSRTAADWFLSFAPVFRRATGCRFGVRRVARRSNGPPGYAPPT